MANENVGGVQNCIWFRAPKRTLESFEKIMMFFGFGFLFVIDMSITVKQEIQLIVIYMYLLQVKR